MLRAPMPSFNEQLRDYLAPRFLLGEELDRGGMGIVYIAEDPRLRRKVAIKAIPPEKASAVATARFVYEARRLAKLEHPNIVRVYEAAPEDCPYHYFVMEYLPGETLEQRLQRRRLTPEEATRLGRHLLSALRLTHQLGIVHRDIKPGNVFLRRDARGEEIGVLTDFGISKSLVDDDTGLTEPDRAPGTRGYMMPEQEHGRAVVQSDLAAVGIVLFEAVTGTRWQDERRVTEPDWSAVPESLERPLRRALSSDPAERWPDADSFERALARRPASLSLPDFLVRSPLRRALSLTGLAAAIVGAVAIGRLKPRVDLQIALPGVEGAVSQGLGDSIVRRLADRMVGFPDFTVGGPGGRWRSKVTVSTRVVASGPSLTIRLDLPRETPIVLSTTAAGWHAVIDPLVDSLLVRLYSGSPLDSQLPRLVLPQSPAGMQAFLAAERAFARAWWDSAYGLYDRASHLDTTCILCRLRHAEVGRFLSQPEDTADESAYRARVSAFPPQYQALIRAELVPLRARLDSLARLNRQWPKFLFGRFRFADELIHRGPLIGRARSEASQYFEGTSDVRRDFVPAWEHLFWLWIAEGDARAAKLDHDTLTVLAPRATTPVRDLLDGAFAWRFLPPAQAESLTTGILPAARARHEPLDAGARYLNAFDAQAGAIWLGAQLDSANDHRESAMLAQMFGFLGTGRPHQSAAVESRVVELFGDPAVELFRLELEATQTMLDPDSGAALRWVALAAHLREFARQAGVELRPRAQWMAALLAQHFGRQVWVVGRETPAPLVALLSAENAAATGDYAAARTRTDALVEVESENTGDPFFRTILHFRRADWEQRLGNAWSADRALSWYENTDVIEYPTGGPQASEVDWAFGVLARWRRAGLQDAGNDRCRLYHDVIRLWGDGESPYAARADSARRAVTALRCSEPAS